MILLSVPNIGGLERTTVNEALASGWVSTAGPEIRLFEENLAAFVGQPAAVVVASGTAGGKPTTLPGKDAVRWTFATSSLPSGSL